MMHVANEHLPKNQTRKNDMTVGVSFLQPRQSYHKKEMTEAKPFPLFDFPEELLLVIAEHLTVKQLWVFATLCRRLHYAVLPIYFQRCGLPKWESFASEGLSMKDENLDALPGLQIAHFVTKIPRITCKFPSSEAHFLESVARLRAVIARISHLQEVTLEFAQITEEEGTELNPLSWVKPVERLLYTISTWNCVRLKVIGGLTCPLGLHQIGSGLRLGHRLSQSISWIGRRSTHFPPPSTVNIEELPYSVTELHIASPMFCYRLFRKWTVNALETRNITKLSLCDMPLERPNQWDTFLSVNMGQLRDLTIIGCSVGFRSIENFLHCHPEIHTLCLDKLTYPPGSRKPFRDWFRCPHLRTLKAPVEYLIQFMASPETAPNLDDIVILGSSPGVSPDFALIPWFSLDVAKALLDEYYEISLSLDIALPHIASLGKAPSEVASTYLAGITTLVVRPGEHGTYLERENWPRFREWLECFPSLTHLTIMDGEAEGMRMLDDPVLKKDFVREMMSVFARVSKVRVNGEDIWTHSSLDPPIKARKKWMDEGLLVY